MVWLQIWLGVVAFLSVFGIYQAFFTDRISTYQFTNAGKQMSPFAQRLFGYWVMVAFMARSGCAISPEEPTLYLVCMGTFIVALGGYLYEAFVSRTIPLKNALGPFFIAGLSLIWMTVDKWM